MAKKLLIDTCEKMGITIDNNVADDFMLYKDLLLEWNEKINLTAIVDEKEIMLKHFADSLSLIPYLDLGNINNLEKKSLDRVDKITKEEDSNYNNIKIIDVGTGAGFPSVPAKIFLSKNHKNDENIRLTLLDSLNKRINFLETVVNELNLVNVDCVHGRAEDIGKTPEFREEYDYCLARAVANLKVLAEYTLPFVKVGGQLVALKGRDFQSEIDEATEFIDKLGGKITNVIDISIPNTDLEHKLVIVEKVKSTPSIYPRSPKKIKSENRTKK